MSFLKYTVPAFAFASGALAQCSAPTTTINSAADASGLSSCQTFTGNVAIATSASGDINFGNLGSIDGDLTGGSPNVTSMEASSLQSISGMFMMANMTQLFTLSMQQLRQIDSIDWNAVTQLQRPDFGTGLNSVKTSISIQNTGIQDLSGINVKQAGTVNIANNQQLTGLTWDTTNCTSFSVSGNGPQQLNLTLSNLEGVNKNFDISNVSSLSAGSLANVGGLLSVQSSNVQQLSLPNLTMTGAVSVANNRQLTNVSMPSLATSSGALSLVNNDHLGGTINFPALTELRGALNITGAYQGVNLPQNIAIGGTVYLTSTEDISSTCTEISNIKSQGHIAGLLPNTANGFVCKGQSSSPTGGSGTGSGTSSGSSSSGSSSGNAAARGFVATPAALFGATGLFAAMLGMM